MGEIVLDTVRKAYQHGERIAAGCLRCGRWKEYSFIELDRAGLADKGITDLNFRCSLCGRRAGKQIRSQVPNAGRAYRSIY